MGGTINSNYTGMRNSKIIQLAEAAGKIFSIIPAGGGYPGGYGELYAQSYAIQLYLKPNNITPTLTIFPTANAVIPVNSYFNCTAAWALDDIGSIAPPPSGACNTAVPSWYPPLIGQ